MQREGIFMHEDFSMAYHAFLGSHPIFLLGVPVQCHKYAINIKMKVDENISFNMTKTFVNRPKHIKMCKFRQACRKAVLAGVPFVGIL